MNLEINSITDFLNYIDYGLIDNNCNENYLVFMEIIHDFVLNSGKINLEFQIEILKQINHMIEKLYNYKNAEFKNDYLKLRLLVLHSLEEDISNYD